MHTEKMKQLSEQYNSLLDEKISLQKQLQKSPSSKIAMAKLKAVHEQMIAIDDERTSAVTGNQHQDPADLFQSIYVKYLNALDMAAQAHERIENMKEVLQAYEAKMQKLERRNLWLYRIWRDKKA